VKYLLKPGFWQSPDPLRLDLGFGIYELSQTTKDVTAKLLFPAPRPRTSRHLCQFTPEPAPAIHYAPGRKPSKRVDAALIDTATRDDHAAYIALWLKVLKDDKRAIFTAASHAQKAADYINLVST
jgi:hypothetical protein